MALTFQQKQQIAQILAQKRQQLGEDEFKGYLSQLQSAVPQKTATATKSNDTDGVAIDLVQGLGKSIGGTALGMGTLGRSIQGGISRAGDAILGKYNPFVMGGPSVFDRGSAANTRAQELVAADTGAEKVGKFVGDTLQFAVPGSYATKATAGMGLATRMAAQGLVGAGVQAAKTGDIGKDELIVGGISALSVPISDALTKGIQSLSDHLPEWLVRPLVKQAPAARLKGKDAAQYLVESGHIGTVDSLIKQSDDAMTAANSQIKGLLDKGVGDGLTVSRDSIVQQIVDQVNEAGGAIDKTQVLGTLDNLAPQARGLLAKETLTVKEANQLRVLLDSTIGDKGFLAKELPYNKQILMDFTNALRETVKGSFDNTDEVVSKQIANHFGSAEQFLKFMPEENLAKNGGMEGLLNRIKTNLIDGLRGEDKNEVADQIAKIAVDQFDSPEAYKSAVLDAVNPVRRLFTEYAKNITVKNALLARATAGGGANSVGLYDILTGGGAFAVSGNPVIALAAAGGRRALESAPVKTVLAQAFKNADKAIPVIQGMEPAARAVVLQFISSLLEDTQANKPRQ